MTRASHVRALCAASALSGLILSMAGCGKEEMTPPGVGWKEIQADMKGKCSTNIAACHGPTAAANALKIDEAAGKEMANYTLVTTMFVNKSTPAESKLLTKPLDAAHGPGGKIFASTNDATYQKWLKWIQDGTKFETPTQ